MFPLLKDTGFDTTTLSKELPMLEKLMGPNVDLKMNVKLKDPKVNFKLSESDITLEYTVALSIYDKA